MNLCRVLKDWFTDRAGLVSELASVRDALVDASTSNAKLWSDNRALSKTLAESLRRNSELEQEIGGVLASIARGEKP